MTASTDTLTQHWIDGAAVAGSGSIAVVNPATGQTLAEVPRGGSAEVDAAVQAARQAFPAWSATPVADRAAAVLRIRDGIKAHHEELAQSITAEMGSPIAFARSVQLGMPMATSKGVAGARRGVRLVRGDRQLAGRARAGRRRRRHHAVELPAAPGRRQARARPRRGLHGGAQAERGRAADGGRARGHHRRGRAAGRGVQRRPRHRPRGRRGARRAPRGGHGVVHRLGRRRAPGAGGGRGHRQAGRPRARRQVREHRARRRRPHQGGQGRARELLHQRRPDLHRLDAAAGAGLVARPGRGDGGVGGGEVRRRRPDRRGDADRADVVGDPARPRGVLHRPRVSTRARSSPSAGPGRRRACRPRARTCGRRSSPGCAAT